MFSRHVVCRHQRLFSRSIIQPFQSQTQTMSTQLPLFQVDSFSDIPFAGNPAAVCLLPASSSSGMWPLSDVALLRIAEENNLSETAFLLPASDTSSSIPFEEDSHFHLRWFTPTKEVDLCGHATLATAAALFQKCGNKNPSLHFETKSGILVATASPGKSAIEIDLPLNPPLPVKHASDCIQTLIKLIVGAGNENAVTDIMYSQRTKKLVLELDSLVMDRQFLERLTVSPSALLQVDQSDLGKNSITGL